MADESQNDTDKEAGAEKTAAKTGNEKANGERAGQAQETQPIVVNGQYIKDFSFENPNAPESLMHAAQQSPAISVAIDVAAKQIQERSYEVVLTLRTEAKREDKVMFLAELQYAGVFTLSEVPQEVVQALVFIEAPRLLFPFARHIIAECVRDGGFPPLMVQPIDFVALFKQRMAQQKASAEASDGSSATA